MSDPWADDPWGEDSGPVRHPGEGAAASDDPGRSTESDGGSATGPAAVQIPDLLRKAMELRGVDPDEVAAKAAAIDQAGGVDALPDAAAEASRRRVVEEAERDDSQMTFDAAAGREARDAAMARVDAAADPEWKDDAWSAIEQLVARGVDFTSDDVWRIVGFKPSEPRALGPLMMRAQRAGMIRNSGNRRNSERPEHHAFPCTVWTPAE
jgi:hypothetical protein